MRVSHAALRYFPALGGAEEYVRSVCEALAKRGHEVHVVASDLEQHARRLRLSDCSGEQEMNGVHVSRVTTKYLPGLSGYPVMPSLLPTLVKQRPDVVHGHCFFYSSADISAVAARILRRPFVLNPYFYLPPGRNWRAYCATLGRLAMDADVVIAISDYEKDLITRAGMRVRRFEVVPPGVETAEFDGGGDDVYASFNINRCAARVVLFVGRLHRSKGVDTLIAAMPTILRCEPETILFLVGPDWGDRARFTRQIQDLGLESKVVLAGPLNRSELVSAYRGAALMVLPSTYEAFGIVLIEAMAARLPVVASNAAAIPYVVSHGETGLLFPMGDHAALANCVVALLRDEHLRRPMGERGRSIVERRYERVEQIRSLEEIYESL